ncbi:MAG: spore germination protein [Firmicutes bacterium]|nr:spore germination protein [Bacillota bacterium]MDH7494934.1 GerAB/ArcD/ProY family transporter [Bacillota bacterium]
MLEEGRIGTGEAVAATLYFLSSKLFISFPQQMATVGLTAAWIVPMISFAGAAVGFLIVTALLRRYPRMGIVEIGEELAGPVLGSLAALGYFAFFFVATVVIMREFSETVGTALLPRTPLAVITLIFALVTIAATYLGVEALTRAALLAAPLIVVTLVFLNVLLVPQANFDAMFPFFGPGLDKLVYHGIIHSAVGGEVLFLAVIAPQLREWSHARAIGLAALAITALFTSVSVLTFVTVFPYPLCVHIPYPGYETSTLIYVGRFFQRVEVAFVFLWVISGCIELALGTYTSAIILARTLKLPLYRPLLPALGVIGYSLAFVPPDVPTATRLDFELVRTFGGIAVFVVPAVLLLAAQVKQVRKAEGGRRKDGA